jgi:hypothetical protein
VDRAERRALARLLDRRARGLFLKLLRGAFDRRVEAAAIVTAGLGAWVLWSPYSELSTLSWWYDRVELARSGVVLPQADYDLTTLPWQAAHPRAFDVKDGRMTLVTDGEPFAYQAFAIVNRNGARAADIQFDATIESGGTTIGLLQNGKWIASSSSRATGRFADTNSALLGSARSITLVVANNNPAGESRLRLDAVRLYLRK